MFLELYNELTVFLDLSSSKSIGSPKNINVQITNDGCLITWDPPDEGLDDLEYYEIRWVENEAVVSAVTTDPFYLGK